MNNRRVSFAATAHVRLFEKEEQNAQNATLQDENLFEIATQKSESSFDITISGSPSKVLAESQNLTPVKIAKNFGLSSQSRSATPLLDAAIKNVSKGFPTDSPGERKGPLDFSSPRFGMSIMILGSPVASTPRSASKFPAMSTAILPVKQESSPTMARNALGSPLVQAGLERLMKSTPKSSSSLRFAQVVMDADESMAISTPGYKTISTSGTPQASTAAGSLMGSPGLLESPVVAKAGRDSMAPFFENTRESLPSNMGESLPTSNVKPKMAGRDSIAPFFDNVRESLPSSFSNRDSLPTAFKNVAPIKMTGRDSVAGFFDNMRDSNIYNPRESIASSKRDSIMSQPMTQSKGRDSIAGFFNNTRNSLMPAYGSSILASPADDSFSSESSMQIDQDSIVLDQDENLVASQDQVELNMEDAVEVESQDVDMSFDQDSVNLAPNVDSSFDSEQSGISMDLTENAKTNPFWDENVTTNNGADESAVLDEPSQSTVKDLNFSTPQGSPTPKSFPDVSVDSPKETFMSTPRAHPNKEESLDLVDVSPVRSTRLRSSAKKTVTQSAYTSVSTKKVKLETVSAPVSPTPVAEKKRKTPVKPKSKTPKKSSGVTPMRRAVAAKALANAIIEPTVTRSRRSSVASNQSPSNPVSSPALPISAKKDKKSRKSLGGNLLQSLQNSFEPISEPVVAPKDEENLVSSDQQVETDEISHMSAIGSEELPVDSQSQFQNSLDDDLMDERHLSVMDDSILQEQVSIESNRPPILDYKEFIESTGIDFEDHSAPIMAVAEETVGNVFEASIADLERENFTQGSAELEKIIADLRKEIDSSKSAINDSVPLLFDEYSQGSSRERQEILAQLRLLKSVCFERAKVEWFSWKELTLDYLFDGLQEYFEEMKIQHNAILPMLEDFKILGSEARDYFETLSRDVPVARDELDAKITAFEQNSTRVAAQKGELSANNAEMKLRIKELQTLTAQANERIFEAEKKEAELCTKIEHSEKTCADLVVFDPADLAALRGQFSVLAMSHGWRPLALKMGRQSWIYDDLIELEFTKQGETYELQSRVYYPIDGEKSIIKAVNSTLSHAILQDIGSCRLSTILGNFDKNHSVVHNLADFKTAMRDLATMWESVKTLFRDIRKARHFTSASIEWAETQNFIIQTKFLNVLSKCHLKAEFSFSSVSGVLLYPYGQVQANFQCDYGSVSNEFDCKVNSVENGPDYLARLCKMIQQSL